jgi:hypothetical protein
LLVTLLHFSPHKLAILVNHGGLCIHQRTE